jgi:hypothetical protein
MSQSIQESGGFCQRESFMVLCCRQHTKGLSPLGLAGADGPRCKSALILAQHTGIVQKKGEFPCCGMSIKQQGSGSVRRP